MESKILCVLILTIVGTNHVQARTRFARESEDDTKVAGLPPLETEIQPPRSGQRELFTLPGPSLDFQQGSVLPAPAQITEGQLQMLRAPALRRSLARGPVDFDDYGEYGSRLHTDTHDIPSPALQEKKPIYVKKLALRNKQKETANLGLETANLETTTEQLKFETTTLGDTPEELEFEVTEVGQLEEATTTSNPHDGVTFDPDGLDAEAE